MPGATARGKKQFLQTLLSVSGEHSHHPEVRELHSGNPLMKRVGAGNMASVLSLPPPSRKHGSLTTIISDKVSACTSVMVKGNMVGNAIGAVTGPHPRPQA